MSLRSKRHGTREAGSHLPDDNSELEPPDPIPNSAVKRFSADGSVGSPHVRVGHRQVSTPKAQPQRWAFSFGRLSRHQLPLLSSTLARRNRHRLLHRTASARRPHGVDMARAAL